MKKLRLASFFIVSSISFCSVAVQAQTDKPYKEGPVWNVSFVQTKPGMSDTYLKNLSQYWAKVAEEAKKQGLIMDFKVIQSRPAAKADWDLMLLMETKNFASLDSMDAKMDAIVKKIYGTDDTQHKVAISRNDMRDLLGEKLGRELIFKD